MDQRRVLGKESEDIGAAWLEARGVRILERNYRCRLGEIDLIGMLDGTLIIVEIRSRSGAAWGTPSESVNFRKRQKLRRVAAWYLADKGRCDGPCRFDVLGLLYNEKKTAVQIEWIPDAF